MLDVNDKVPPFRLPSAAAGREGESLRLEDFAGQWLVIYFYPRNDTPGCTREAQAFHAAASKLKAAGAAVVGVSKDSVKSHCSFGTKYGLGFPLLSDPDLTLHKTFGAYGEKTMYGKKVEGVIRSTFILTPDGKLARAFRSVKVDGHVDKVLEALAELRTGSPGPDAKPAARAASKTKTR